MKFELEDYHRNTPDNELIADLKRVALELNKTSVTRAEQDDRGKFHTTTYIRHFGSWFNALEKAGLEKTRTPMNLPEEELFQNLVDNHDTEKCRNHFLSIMSKLMKPGLELGAKR